MKNKEAILTIEAMFERYDLTDEQINALILAQEEFENIDNGELVEVVRCKDCKHWDADTKDGEGFCECDGFNKADGDDLWTAPNDFCSDASKKAD